MKKLPRRKKKPREKKEKKVYVYTRGGAKFPRYRVHSAKSGRPVTMYVGQFEVAKELAVDLCRRTGKTYLIYRSVARVTQRKHGT